ncbi:fatty acid synthase alpha subunit Lsd1 [Paramarasmius palmivorus]|uniref:Fatty acid synthase alpha subunit Lsd1 n=1 Tax=Paramarasmius palmivorus TaxID=297713 RepID=A0AAW0AZC0_9AGAR
MEAIEEMRPERTASRITALRHSTGTLNLYDWAAISSELDRKNADDKGARAIVLGDRAKGGAEFYDFLSVKYEDNWSRKWSPGRAKTSDGSIHLDTPFSHLLGKSPIMVAGMTPSTVKGGFVSAVLDAGYRIELAGGSHYNAAAL